MSTAALLALAGVAAMADWWAVGTRRRRAETILKPAAMLLLVGVAAVAGDASGGVRAWLVAGAVLGLVGDVALLGRSEAAFMAGLGAFAVGHLAYAAAAVGVGVEAVWMLPGGVVMALLLSYRFASDIAPGARRHGGGVLFGLVWCYAAVITAMAVTAWGSASPVAAAGATLFAVSDWVLGHERFAGPLPGGRLAVMVPYHVGQALLIVGLATA